MLMKKVSLIALLLLQLQFVFNVTATKTETLTLDVTAPARGFTAFVMQELHRSVLRTTTAIIEGRPVLGKQKTSQEPDTWIHVVLKGAQGDTATLAIRSDNLYLVGFRTQGGSWYAFKNKVSLIPGSTALTFNDDYKSLTGGKGYKDLVNVVVGKGSAQQATSNLARYKQHGSIPEEEVRKALATFVLMICEAERLTTIRKAVIAAWDDGGKVPQSFIELVVKWKDISCALLSWEKTKNWKKIPEAKIIELLGDPPMADAKAAAQNVNFVLQATGCQDAK